MRRARRPGFTILELLVVIAILVVLGAILVPTLKGLSRDVNVRAAADTLVARVADARAHALAESRTYLLSLSPDGSQVRVSADPYALQNDDPDAALPFQQTTEFPREVTVAVVRAADDQPPAVSADGWQTVATFLPDGTCRESVVEIQISEPDVYTLGVTVRGLTGAVSVAPVPAGQQRQQGQRGQALP